MRLLLDTHVWWWWITGETGLSAAQKRALDKASRRSRGGPTAGAASSDLAIPPDRILVATARVQDATLLTTDERIIDAKLAPTIR